MPDEPAGKPCPIDGDIDQSMLDEALEETFPASDPVALVLPRRSVIDCPVVKQASAQVRGSEEFRN